MPRSRRSKAVAGVKATTTAVRSTSRRKVAEPSMQNQDNDLITLSRKDLAELATSIADKILENKQNECRQQHQDKKQTTSNQVNDFDDDEDPEDETTNMINLLVEESASLPVTMHENPITENELDIPYNPTLPIDFAVSDKLKSKIISDQYVSFSQLLSPDSTEKFTLQFNKTQQGPSLSFAPTKTKEFITYHEWTKAFEIYASIYLTAHPKSGPGLMKYGADIRELFTAYGGTAWKVYDETMLKWRASSSSARLWPWGRTYTEMWLKATKFFLQAKYKHYESALS